MNIQSSQAIDVQQIDLELEVVNERLDIDTAIPVGLILNELITNCYKYAFKAGEKGKIAIAFNKQNNKYRLKVSDNGIGFSPEVAKTKTNSIGLSLVKGLVRQLRGSIEWLPVEKAAAVVVRF